MELLIATNNRGKVERYRMLMKDVTIHTLQDLGIESVEVDENESLRENAINKAKAYFQKTDLPILANDTGLYVEGEGLIEAPKRAAIGSENLTEEEIYNQMISFWQGIARKHGGEVDACWIESFALVSPDGSVRVEESRREIVLTDRIFGRPHINFPIRALYISKNTGKSPTEHTAEDELKEMKPVQEALTRLLYEI